MAANGSRWRGPCNGFDEAGLSLPDRLIVGFDPSGEQCGFGTGRAEPAGDPPTVWVCRDEPENFHGVLETRITLLHELAHVWHWELGSGSDWTDLRDIVGGELGTCDDAAASDLMVERVAVVISWGLLDQTRRPVAADVSCVTLYRQFVELTGRQPIGPLEVVCFPDPTWPAGAR